MSSLFRVLQSVEGRKVWLTAKLSDGPAADAKVYLEAKCLFIVVRKD